MVGASTRWCHRSDDSPTIYASCEVNESHPHGDAWLKDRSPEKCFECGKVLPSVLISQHRISGNIRVQHRISTQHLSSYLSLYAPCSE